MCPISTLLEGFGLHASSHSIQAKIVRYWAILVRD